MIPQIQIAFNSIINSIAFENAVAKIWDNEVISLNTPDRPPQFIVIRHLPKEQIKQGSPELGGEVTFDVYTQKDEGDSECRDIKSKLEEAFPLNESLYQDGLAIYIEEILETTEGQQESYYMENLILIYTAYKNA